MSRATKTILRSGNRKLVCPSDALVRSHFNPFGTMRISVLLAMLSEHLILLSGNVLHRVFVVHRRIVFLRHELPPDRTALAPQPSADPTLFATIDDIEIFIVADSSPH